MSSQFRRPFAAFTGAALLAFAAATTACGVLPFTSAPAARYLYASGEPLVVAVIDETGGDEWDAAIEAAGDRYVDNAPLLRIQNNVDGANIVVRVRRYRDQAPPELQGYLFQPGVGGFAAVYDADGAACNFPPSRLPLNCSGEIATAFIYLNDVIPSGDDIDARRERLLLHELGHALGLTRHAPDLSVDELALRYGWPEDAGR